VFNDVSSDYVIPSHLMRRVFLPDRPSAVGTELLKRENKFSRSNVWWTKCLKQSCILENSNWSPLPVTHDLSVANSKASQLTSQVEVWT